jgi:pimeloyl-ACP methyl ester carboxylesterase
VQRLEQLVLFPGHLLGGPHTPHEVHGRVIVTLHTPQGDVEGWFLPPFDARPDERRPVVVFAHGNGEIIDQWADELAPYRSLGVGVFLPEYRGYGRSAGTPSEAAIAEDFVAFYDALVQRPDVDGARIVLHGRSLGGGAVCGLAKQRPAAGLVLESTFTSVAAVARRWLVPPGILTNRFDNEPVVREFPHPVLVFHGRHDRVIPYSHGQALARIARRAKLVTYDCDHNDMLREPADYWRELESYLKSVTA